MSFESLGLSPALLRALEKKGYDSPTPIQSAAIPIVLAGRDLMAGSQTGTGKTAAFTLPLLERLFPNGQRADNGRVRRPRALVLTPTRELAAQVHDSVRDYGRQLRMHSTAIFGGVGMGGQLQHLRRGVDVLIATPGRLLDHMQQGNLELSGIEVLILDEADRMLDMGFLPALRKIVAATPRKRQTLLFSATFPDPIKALAAQFLRQPEQLQITPPNTVVATVSHRMHPVDSSRKRELLQHILAEDSRRQTLVFSRTKHGANKLVQHLEKTGFRAAAIHGNKSQGQRTRALQAFKDGKVTVLVATDIAARGLDIQQLPMVINHDLPMVAEDYVHRIGRTGRAGATGLAVSLVSQDETGLLMDIQKVLKKDIEVRTVPGFEPLQPLRMDRNARPTQKQRTPRAGRPNGKPGNGKPGGNRRPHSQQGPKPGAHAPASKRRKRKEPRRARRSP